MVDYLKKKVLEHPVFILLLTKDLHFGGIINTHLWMVALSGGALSIVVSSRLCHYSPLASLERLQLALLG